ncbi:MAG: 2-C-methyl-D-erythritol 4-phosphate cytidylyltransferase [Erysipelotrichaceae bacterium]|nr:2-C-methyl-D-erythritol 4-phosphate cytidylyltransferase [Erysipelotrichaceae bacterium]
MKIIAIILLGGSSTRFEYKTAKQFFDINGKPVAYYAIKPFLDSKYINEIVLVCRKEDISYYKELLKCEKKKIHYVIGGDSRSQSSKNALKYLQNFASDDDIILIHDGARLFVSDNEIKSLIDALIDAEAATLAIRCEDSIARIKNNEIISYEDRNQLVRIQTPQAFRYKLIKKLVDESKDLSDDAQFALLQNEKLLFVNGNKKINKITTIEDIDYIIYSVEKEND